MAAESLIRLALLAATLAPMTYVNLRTERLPNAYSLLVFATGLAFLALRHALGWTQGSFAVDLALTAIEAIGFYLALAVLRFPGGAGKAVVALTPWFGFWPLVAVFAVASLGSFALAKAGGRSVGLFGPPLFVAALAAALV